MIFLSFILDSGTYHPPPGPSNSTCNGGGGGVACSFAAFLQGGGWQPGAVCMGCRSRALHVIRLFAPHGSPAMIHLATTSSTFHHTTSHTSPQSSVCYVT